MNTCSSLRLALALAALIGFVTSTATAAEAPNPGEADLTRYFQAETERLASACLTGISSLDEWKSRQHTLRAQLFEMLGLSPLPPRTELKPVITGVLEQEDYSVEKLQFQSMPGLYVTANLYLPKAAGKPAPAVLYVCGHAIVRTNGVSYGNKTAYQHHGVWFARNGYVCLMLDTIQLGEIQGLHHGTYREGQWWWNARGYTPAGVEAWNCIRALDYLQSRSEVDGERLGVTGRSGGGAYSWWTAALDDRIKAAAPVAGITDLHNHVVDGTVDGHCDCMFFVNTYQWDYPALAALVAPRPLLICNSDKDSIFPLDGVERLHAKVAAIYKLCGAANRLGLLVTEGPHKDTQDLQLPVFRWFNRHLKGEDPIIDMAARPAFTPAQLKVFDSLPRDERVTSIQETFVPVAQTLEPAASLADWNRQQNEWKTVLREKVFRAWPDPAPPLNLRRNTRAQNANAVLEVFEFDSQPNVPLRMYVLRGGAPGTVAKARVKVTDSAAWAGWISGAATKFTNALRDELAALAPELRSTADDFTLPATGEAEIAFAPRGLGWHAWPSDARRQWQIRRRFMLLGQTQDSMRVWDVRRAIDALRHVDGFAAAPITLEASRELAVDSLYAILFRPGPARLVLSDLPRSHQTGPDYLNVLRFLDIPQAVAMAADTTSLELRGADAGAWPYPRAVAARLGWPDDRLRFAP